MRSYRQNYRPTFSRLFPFRQPQMAICVCVCHLSCNGGLRSHFSSGHTETLRVRLARITPKTVRRVMRENSGQMPPHVTLGPCCAGAPPARSLAPPYCRGVAVCHAAKQHSALPYGNGRRIQGRTQPRLLSPEGCLCCCSSHVGWKRGRRKTDALNIFCKDMVSCLFIIEFVQLIHYAGKPSLFSGRILRKLTSTLILLHKCSFCR